MASIAFMSVIDQSLLVADACHRHARKFINVHLFDIFMLGKWAKVGYSWHSFVMVILLKSFGSEIY